MAGGQSKNSIPGHLRGEPLVLLMRANLLPFSTDVWIGCICRKAVDSFAKVRVKPVKLGNERGGLSPYTRRIYKS